MTLAHYPVQNDIIRLRDISKSYLDLKSSLIKILAADVDEGFFFDLALIVTDGDYILSLWLAFRAISQ